MKFTRLTFAFTAMASAVILGGTPLKAQGAFDMGMLTGSLSIDHVTQTEAARAVNSQVFDISALSAPQSGNIPDAGNYDFSYNYSAPRMRENLSNFIERSPNPEAKAELQKIISAQPNLINEVGQAIRPLGLDSHDVADAYAFWWINSWLVANQRNEDPDRGTIAMVKQQVRNAIAATPDFATTNDQQRQEYAEALLLQGTMLASAFEQYQGKPDMLRQLSDAARKGAKASGIDLSLMTLTKNGFVPRDGAAASEARVGEDAAEADPKLAMATEQSAENDEEDMPNYLGYGAAALAGLGLAFAAGKVIGGKG